MYRRCSFIRLRMRVCSMQHVSTFTVALIVSMLTLIAYYFICVSYAIVYVRVGMHLSCECYVHRNHAVYVCNTSMHRHVSLHAICCIYAYRSRIMYVHHAYIVYTHMYIQDLCTYVRVSLVHLISPVALHPCPSPCWVHRRCSDLSRFYPYGTWLHLPYTHACVCEYG
jgi:hypothetical protein